MRKLAFALQVLFTLTPTIQPVIAQVSVLTQHNDLLRTGSNLAESQLTTGNVNVNTFGMLFSYPVDASVYAQPLYVPSVQISGKGTHNVVYVATMNDSVYAFDADTNNGPNANPLWSVNYTNPGAGVTAIPSTDIQTSPNVSGPMGIMGTPVIDRSTGTMYLVARTLETGVYVQRLHAIDITSGAEKFGGPVTIQASVPGTGYDSSNGVVQFNPMTANQRCGLALTNGRVVIAWGGLDDDFDPYHGWVMTFSASTLQRLAVFNTSSNGSRAGIWESGSAPPVDANGNVYFTTGNGTWDASNSFGDSMLKLNPNSSLALSDWFTPDNQEYLSSADLDLGVSGPLLLPNTNLLLGGSKTGDIYLLNTANMGHQVAGNGQIIQILKAGNGHIHGAPVYFNSPALGPLIYVWSEGDYLKAFHFNGSTFDTAPATQSAFQDPAGMPGGILSISANGSQAGTGILWAALPLNGNAETSVVPGVLRAFDASNLSNELWNSNQNAGRDAVGTFGKFCPPTIVNGKVYLATFSNVLRVYGLISTTPDFTLNVTPGTQTLGLSTTRGFSTSVTALNAFTGTTALTVAGLPNGVTAAFSPVSVSGSGTSTLTVTASGSATLGTYPLTISATSGSLTHAVVVNVIVTSGAAGLLSGSMAPSTGSQNLAQTGTSDWAHWGLTAPNSFDHKSGVTQQISNLTALGGGTVLQYGDNPVGFSWTSGTPTASTSNTTTGVYIAGQNNGFQISAPADTTSRTLTLYVGVWMAQGRMVAHLSDGSAVDFVDSSLSNPNGTTTGAYTFTYQAASSGQSLNITFSQISAPGNVTLQAATLQAAPSASIPDFSISSSPGTQSIALNGSASFTVTVASLNGFAGGVSLGVSTLPAGLNSAFAPAGSGNTTLTLSANSSALPGTYPIAISGTSGSLTHTTNVNLTVTSGGTAAAGVLTGNVTLPLATQNLTQLGVSDWAHWGSSAPNSFDHKSGGNQQISNVAAVGNGTFFQYSNNPVGYSWTDGAPTAADTNTTTGIYIVGQNNGFRLTVPADTTTRTLTIYAGVWIAQGKMVAHLTDGSAADFVDTSLNNPAGPTTGAYTLTYQAASSGQSLVITFTQLSVTGNVTLQAAALQTAQTVPAPDFSLSAAQGIQPMGPNTTRSVLITETALNGFGGATTFSVTGLPSGITAAFAPASVSGSGTSTLTLTAGGSPVAGTYPLTVSGISGSITHTAGVSVTVTAAGPVGTGGKGSLSGSVTPSAGTQNLTLSGSTDWAHWGLNTPNSSDHESGVTQQISNFTVVGNGSALQYSNNPVGFTWTNGTPTASASNTTTGVYIVGQNNGFQISAPADTTARKLTVYVGVWIAQGKMVAHLSDGSAADFVDTSLNNPDGTTTGAYSFTYQAASSGQSLIITFTQFSVPGNITLQAATLQTVNTPAVTSDFSITATPNTQSMGPKSTQTVTITVSALNGFSGTTTLGVAGLPPGVTAAFAPASVSGSGTLTLTLTAGASPTPGTYPLTVSGTSGSLTHTTAVNLTVTGGTTGGAGLLSGIVATPAAALNLTQAGVSDWAHWGLTGPGGFDHRSGVTQQISNFTTLGGAPVQQYGNNPLSFSWTGGTPSVSATDSTTGIYIVGQNNGFQLTAPADTTSRTLTVYVGVWIAQGKMVAHLSDGSAADFVDTSLNNPNGTTNGAYTFTYKAATSGQSLKLTFTQISVSGNVTLQASTLSP